MLFRSTDVYAQSDAYAQVWTDPKGSSDSAAQAVKLLIPERATP